MELATILVTDDDEGMILMLQESFEAHGYKVITASSGSECLAKAQENIPDLIITDINMPHVSGTTGLHMLKQNPATHEIPVIVMTANFSEDNIRLAKKYKADDIVEKPFKIEDMLKKVQMFLLTTKTDQIRAMISLLEKEKEDLSTIVSAAAGIPWHVYSANHEGIPLCIMLPLPAKEITDENSKKAVILARMGNKWKKIFPSKS